MRYDLIVSLSGCLKIWILSIHVYLFCFVFALRNFNE